MSMRRLLFRRPDGGHSMVLERDRVMFEGLGFTYVGPYDDEEPVALAPVPTPEIAPTLAVESRALEQPRRVNVRRKG